MEIRSDPQIIGEIDLTDQVRACFEPLTKEVAGHGDYIVRNLRKPDHAQPQKVANVLANFDECLIRPIVNVIEGIGKRILDVDYRCNMERANELERYKDIDTTEDLDRLRYGVARTDLLYHVDPFDQVLFTYGSDIADTDCVAGVVPCEGIDLEFLNLSLPQMHLATRRALETGAARKFVAKNGQLLYLRKNLDIHRKQLSRANGPRHLLSFILEDLR
ncbi:MAG: hypothetical protein AAB373_03075 [Patescibacteria group bacterium]